MEQTLNIGTLGTNIDLILAFSLIGITCFYLFKKRIKLLWLIYSVSFILSVICGSFGHLTEALSPIILSIVARTINITCGGFLLAAIIRTFFSETDGRNLMYMNVAQSVIFLNLTFVLLPVQVYLLYCYLVYAESFLLILYANRKERATGRLPFALCLSFLGFFLSHIINEQPTVNHILSRSILLAGFLLLLHAQKQLTFKNTH